MRMQKKKDSMSLSYILHDNKQYYLPFYSLFELYE